MIDDDIVGLGGLVDLDDSLDFFLEACVAL